VLYLLSYVGKFTIINIGIVGFDYTTIKLAITKPYMVEGGGFEPP
jgi:hypothetical protein